MPHIIVKTIKFYYTFDIDSRDATWGFAENWQMDENILTPVILSASRSTDIPAFYADWFVSRLREGWCGWKNTYSGIVHKVSFDKTRMIVFWSKNPAPMLERLDEIEALGFRQYYFQFTLNGYLSHHRQLRG